MNKRILSLGFAVALSWSTAVVFAQEQAAAPVHKERDTWQFNFSRKGQVASSTEQNDGVYELSIAEGVVKIYGVNGSQKNEIPIQPDGPSQGLLRLIGKSDQHERPTVKFPLSVGQKWTYQYVTRPPNTRRDQRRSVEVSVAKLTNLSEARAGPPELPGLEATIRRPTSTAPRPEASLRVPL